MWLVLRLEFLRHFVELSRVSTLLPYQVKGTALERGQDLLIDGQIQLRDLKPF